MTDQLDGVYGPVDFILLEFPGDRPTGPAGSALLDLVDELPEEATEWKRSVTHGEVFVSTNDEPAMKNVELAEVV